MCPCSAFLSSRMLLPGSAPCRCRTTKWLLQGWKRGSVSLRSYGACCVVAQCARLETPLSAPHIRCCTLHSTGVVLMHRSSWRRSSLLLLALTAACGDRDGEQGPAGDEPQ